MTTTPKAKKRNKPRRVMRVSFPGRVAQSVKERNIVKAQAKLHSLRGGDTISSTLQLILKKKAATFPEFRDLAIALHLDPEDVSVGVVLSCNFLHQSLGGKASFIKELITRAEGRVPEPSVRDEVTRVLQDIVGSLPEDQAVPIKKGLLGRGVRLEGQKGHIPNNNPIDGSSANPQEAARQRSIAFYRAVVEDPLQPAGVRLKAQERLDVLLGLIDPSGTGQSAEEFAQQVQSFIQQATKATA